MTEKWAIRFIPINQNKYLYSVDPDKRFEFPQDLTVAILSVIA